MSRLLNGLDPRFLPYACELLARAAEQQIPVLIVNTRRTAKEQAEYVKNGTSWVKHSLHQDGLAIDIVPYAVFQLNGPDKLEWNPGDPAWLKLGLIGESLGLRWGGRFKQKDLGHFEFKSNPGSSLFGQ